MPDRARYSKLQILEINVLPAKREQFTDPKTGCRVEESQGALSDGQLAEKELKFRKFKNVRNLLPFRALPNELDRVTINPLVSHRVMKDCAHDVPNLGFRRSRPLDAPEPLFNGHGFDLIQTVIPPAWQNPTCQVAFISGSSRERLPVLIVASQFLQPVVIDQFGDCSRRAFRLRGSLVGVNAQCMSCFEGGCLCR
jgi:hypothetical protein